MADIHERIVVEKRGVGITAIIAILLVGIMVIAAYFLVTNESRKDKAVEGAAQSVGKTADKVGSAVDKAVDNAAP